MNDLIKNIENWFAERDLLAEKNLVAQLNKLRSEVDELEEAMDQKDMDGFRDAIGDIFVVLTGMARIKGCSVEDCVKEAFNEIKDRQGVTVEGMFIKRADLEKLPSSVRKALINRATFNNLDDTF